MRCSYCHQRGHNKRTCPVLTSAEAARRNRCRTLDGYYIRQYQERIAPGQEESQQLVAIVGKWTYSPHLRCYAEGRVAGIHHNAHVRVAHDYIVGT